MSSEPDAKPVHERDARGAPWCGAKSLSLGKTTRETTCHRCLKLLRDSMLEMLADVVRKLAVPKPNPEDHVRIEIYIDRVDGKPSSDPLVILPDTAIPDEM